MEIQYVHVKTRSQFGKQCIFEDEGPTIVENILPNRDLMNDYIHRNPCHVGVQNSKQFAVHEAQTTSAPTKESGMSHTEGGWPKEMNPKDEEATARFRRRVEKDDIWPIKMRKLLEPMERCVLQNNAVDIYENFFDDMETTELVLPLDVRTVNEYEDPETVVRPITHLSWSPDHGKRLAVSYCSREFERVPVDRNPWSYIWEIENPNKPFMALQASCPSVTMEFNPRDPSMLISGLMSGQVCNWDIRQGNKPVQMSHLQFSHRNPTNLALWINSKTNTEFFSASTGGAIKWWDLRKLREPTETLVMDLENPARADVVRAIGVSALQFEPTMGTKFMAGMENGIVVSGTRKGKNAQEKLALRFSCHDGPVVSIDRNPFSTKNFLTIGGWVARIWAEDTREGNLVSNKRDKIALTGGRWSTSRYSVFYLIDESGVMKIYDVLVGMKSPIKTIRLCENGLKAIAPHEAGTLVAVGSDAGKVYLVQSSEGLTTNARNDKLLMTTYMERCSRYEKAVDNRLKEVHLAKRISYEQMEEPVLPTKGKTKKVSKDGRFKEVNASDKRTEDKGTRGSIVEDREKKSKMKMKRAKDAAAMLGDPELTDAEIRYYEVINKETEKYAEIAALEEEEVGVPSTAPTSKRKKHDDSKLDKETSGGAAAPAASRRVGTPEKRDERDRRKGRKSRSEKVSKGHSKIEEIVIVRRKKGEEYELKDGEVRIAEDMNEQKELEIITEENDDDATMTNEKKRLVDSSSGDKRDLETPRDKGKKRVKRGKRVEVEKPCHDYVCRADICCVDETVTPKSGAKYKKIESTTETSAEDSETEIMIEEMLINLPKVASPDELGYLLEPIDDAAAARSEKLILTKKDARPSLLDEAVKIAKRETDEWRDLKNQGKSISPIKSQSETMRGSRLDEIFTEIDRANVNRDDSKLVDRVAASFGGISIEGDNNDDDEKKFTIEEENYTIMEKESEMKRKKKKVQIASDCQPIEVKFGEKEIKQIIGRPDAPRPSSTPRFDESRIKITKTEGDYPRISAAAIPKLEVEDDRSSK